MIPLVSAVALWMHLLIPAPFNFLLDAIAIGFVLWRNAKGVIFVVLALALGSLTQLVHAHPQMVSLANEFQSRQVLLEITAINRVRVVDIEKCEPCRGAVGSYFGEGEAGDQLKGFALLRPSQGFGDFVAKGKLQLIRAKASPVSLIRKAFLENLGGVSAEARALVAGLAIGDKSIYPKEFTDKLKTLSLTHLSAVSGANCAIVIGLVYWLLGRLRFARRTRIASAVAVLLGYVALVGSEPSVIRSAIMAVVVLLFALRGIWPLAALGIAASVMLLFDPSYATDYGFALSVFATGGILVLTPALAQFFANRLPKWLALTLAATIAAQLWCMPVLLSLQGGIPTYSVLANLLVEPVVAPITILGILACLFAFLVPPVGALFSWLASLPAQWIAVCADSLVKLPATTISWHTGLIGMVILVLSLSFAIFRKTFAMFAVLVLLVEVGFNGFALVRNATWLPGDWQIVNCDVGQGDALVIRSREQVAVVDVGRSPDAIDECLRELGVKQIDLLMLTHFDMDHVGGLEGALKGRKVATGMITSYQDERPAAAETKELLTSHSDRLITGAIGAHGQLGDFTWRVLSPTPSASEAEDSNDGSIVASWSAPGLLLYTMADLGAKGQMRLPPLAHPENTSVVLKVSHHGSADQFPELIEAMHPDLALISVGKDNGYGHPTSRTLRLLQSLGAEILRTDEQGALAISSNGSNLAYAVGGGG